MAKEVGGKEGCEFDKHGACHALACYSSIKCGAKDEKGGICMVENINHCIVCNWHKAEMEKAINSNLDKADIILQAKKKGFEEGVISERERVAAILTNQVVRCAAGENVIKWGEIIDRVKRG